MRLHKLLVLTVLFSMVLAACAPGASAPVVSPQETEPVPTPVIDNSQPPAAVIEAQKALAAKLNIAPGLIKVQAVEQVEWPNACLGVQGADEACAEMIVPGYRAVLESAGQTYEVHTNADGTQVRFADEGGKGVPGGEDLSPAAAAARAAISAQQGVALDAVKIISAEAVDWPDSCLGIVNPAETCLAAITPGFKVLLEVDGNQYQVNTNADGSVYRVVEGTVGAPAGSGASPDTAVEAAKQLLAQQLGVSAGDIQVVESEAVDWPNGCLGVEMPGRMCTQMVTPGFRILLEQGGKTYAFHTDEAGGAIYPAIAPLPQTADKVLVWEQTEGAACTRVEVGSKGVAFGACGKELQQADLQLGRAEELTYLFATYANFTSATKAGTVVFQGQGQSQPEESEMRSIAEWARLVGMEAQGGRSGAAWGSALSWHREGGIAGFCNDMVIYRSGWAAPSSCKGNQPRAYNNFRLSADELTRLYTWVDQYKRFELEQSDPGVKDGMTIRMTFEGTGSETAPAEVQDEIAQFAGLVYGNAVQ